MATRLAISDAATRLIFAKGFDKVTIDEVAEAADVGRMTVFNHFPRKEDMFFDRQQEIHDFAFDSLRTRPAGTSPIEALRLLAHRLIEDPHPALPLFDATQRFVETALESDALKSRARQMRDEFALALAVVMAGAVDRPDDDVDASLTAGMIAAISTVAFLQAHALLTKTGDGLVAKHMFLDLIDRGMMGVAAALTGTPYA